ncbi:hexokinase-3 isoform X3 [Falco rusticolus]|uniref:hexokinase-3 isoform X3 n=1 Tax=Falco rusticolus TaxID=120794 RepID=UPI00188679A0|nr:hexokinase-3 isoform X3 [Falco rusticolus]
MLQVVKGRMLQAMHKGLSRQTHAQANVRMLPTYICSTPDGTEKGDLLVVELCQSHVRIMWVTLLGDGNQSPQVMYKIFSMPGDIMQGKGEALFDFIAQCVRQFLAGISSPQHRLPLGFVFPFSCRHTRLDKAELISWSKGFSCSDVEGKDIVQLLQSAINKQELYHVDVVALMNDTVGTMMTCSMAGKPCEVALVVGTGTNSCFMAMAQQVEMAEETSGQMCVSTEWGCFGDDGTLSDILTPYDQCVDEESSNPGEKRFEKLVSSLYLGEIVRHVLTALAAEKALFIGSNVAVLRTKGVLKIQQVLEIIDNEEGMAEARRALEALGLRPSERDCCRVQQICQAVVSRAATLCAAGLAAILSHMCQSQELKRLVVNVGVDSELYRGHTRFGEILQSVTELLAPECMATLLPSIDGTGWGAAMVTAVALRLAAQRHEVDQVLAPLRLSRADLQRVQALMRQEMELGLGWESNANASVRMLPTYVCGTPNGTERGEFLVLDLGGTNFRVLLVRMAKDGIHMASKIYVIPTTITQGTGEVLFDHIIECIMDFQLKHNLTEQVLPLGFTFSFPCQQLGLDKAVLLSWTKGFSASGCVGQDVVQLLQEAAQRKQHLGLKVVAVVNDTVGTMMSCGYDDPKCEIGLIVGEEHLCTHGVSHPLTHHPSPRGMATACPAAPPGLAVGVTPARGLQGQGPTPVTWRRCRTWAQWRGSRAACASTWSGGPLGTTAAWMTSSLTSTGWWMRKPSTQASRGSRSSSVACTWARSCATSCWHWWRNSSCSVASPAPSSRSRASSRPSSSLPSRSMGWPCGRYGPSCRTWNSRPAWRTACWCGRCARQCPCGQPSSVLLAWLPWWRRCGRTGAWPSWLSLWGWMAPCTRCTRGEWGQAPTGDPCPTAGGRRGVQRVCGVRGTSPRSPLLCPPASPSTSSRCCGTWRPTAPSPSCSQRTAQGKGPRSWRLWPAVGPSPGDSPCCHPNKALCSAPLESCWGGGHGGGAAHGRAQPHVAIYIEFIYIHVR